MCGNPIALLASIYFVDLLDVAMFIAILRKFNRVVVTRKINSCNAKYDTVVIIIIIL